jgi:hypothetical protein
MTIAEQTVAAHRYAGLWRALMPDIETPGDDQFMMWAGNYKESQITRGINGAARKFRAMRNISQPMTADDVARYATSIMRNEAMGVRRFDR